MCGDAIGPKFNPYIGTVMPFHMLLPYTDMWKEENNGLLVEGIGSATEDLRGEQCFYWLRGSIEQNKAFEALYVASEGYESELIWQIDVNITALRGVTVSILNGTSLFDTSEGFEINEYTWS